MRPAQHGVVPTAGGNVALDKFQHFHELGEDQYLPPFGVEFLEQGEEARPLGALRHLAGGIEPDETRGVANLPQLQEHVENHDAGCGQASRRDGVTDPRIHRCPDAEIEGICTKITNLRLLATPQCRVQSPVYQPAH